MGPNEYARQLLKASAVQILQTIGFKCTHQIPLNILVELFERHIVQLARSAKEFTELANRTEPTLDDVAAALDKFKVGAGDLDEFMNWVDVPEFDADKVPARGEWSDVVPPRSSARFRDRLNYNYDESEAKDRESDEEFEHVYDFMPVMRLPEPAPASVPAPAETAAAVVENAGTLEQSGVVQDASMASPSRAAADTPAATLTDEQRQQQQIEIIKRQLSIKAQAVVTKNGRTYSNYTWGSLFRPSLMHSELKSLRSVTVGAPGETSAMETSTVDEKGSAATPAKAPEAKMPPYYHKPLIRQRKQHLMGLAANLNKPTPAAVLANLACPPEEPSKPAAPAVVAGAKSEPEPTAAPVEPINPVSTVKSADEVYTSIEIEKTAIVLGIPEQELEAEASSSAAAAVEKTVEVKQLKLKIKEKQVVEMAELSGGAASEPTDEKRQPAIPKLKIASLKKNLSSHATSSPMVPIGEGRTQRPGFPASSSSALAGGKEAPKRTESLVFDSSQIFAIDLGLDEDEDMAGSIAGASESAKEPRLELFGGSNKWPGDDGAGGVEEGEVAEREQPISIKIKRTKDSYNAVTAESASDASEAPGNGKNGRFRSEQEEFNYGLDGDNFDDNAMDGLDSYSKAAGSKSTASSSGKDREQPTLIWKPSTSAKVGESKPRQESEAAAPALAPFSIGAPLSKAASKPPLSLVDSTYLSSNSNDSVSRAGVPGLLVSGEPAAEDGDTRSSVLSGQSNQQQRVLAVKEGGEQVPVGSGETVKSKKNKEKKKKDKDKEKSKKKLESLEEAGADGSLAEAIGEHGEEGASSKQHKKKKKNKDKQKDKHKEKERHKSKEQVAGAQVAASTGSGGEKVKEKSKESKDKKHHHEKEKSKKSSGDDKASPDSERSLSPGSSRKLDKKLKKQLKKEQKRLEKSANALVVTPVDVESLHLHQEIDVETVHENEESQAQSLINESAAAGSAPVVVVVGGELEAGEIRRPLDDASVAPRLPKIKLKIGGSSTLLPTDASADSPGPVLSPLPPPPPAKDVVKPLKISIGKKPVEREPSPLMVGTVSGLNEEEIELGEIVRPKATAGFSQEPPKLQPHPIPKLIIKPQKPPSSSAEFEFKHGKDSATAAAAAVAAKKRKFPSQQQIPQLQYTPQSGFEPFGAGGMDVEQLAAGVDLSALEQAAFAASTSGLSKKQRLSSFSSSGGVDGSELSPPLLTPSSQHARSQMSQQAAAAAAQMRIVSCRTEETSQQVWICPSCNKADKGSMIGCDSCDDWYHWKCVGITREPPDDQNWYCNKCGANDHRAKSGGGGGGGAAPDETGSVKSETFDDARSDTSEQSAYDANGEPLKRRPSSRSK